ncbi:hypothetical protein ALHIDCOG_00382 [Klebsiella phage CPRSB]|nr:hypothetical protein ALHIDCOG_00382 [Klebsiella phage CPRSB]
MLFDGFKLERQLVQLRKIRDLLAEGLLVLEHRVNLKFAVGGVTMEHYINGEDKIQ